MIKKYSFATDEDKVYQLYNKILGNEWPIDKEQFYDVLVHEPPSKSVASFISVSQGKMNGFISTQIMNKRGSIVLLLFEPGQGRIGEKLLEKAMEHFRKNAVTNVQLGAGAYTSFWPGVPTNLPQLISFFERRGWQFSENSVDMVRDIGNYVTPKEVYERIGSIEVTLQFLKKNENEIEKLLVFEHQNFPRWERYFSETLERQRLNEILVAKTKDNEMVGSLLVRKQSVMWAKLLGDNIGTIGVLGVAESMRGKGIGLALAARATEILKEQHVQTCYLSWTWLTDWYGKLGYIVWREYKMSWKEL